MRRKFECCASLFILPLLLTMAATGAEAATITFEYSSEFSSGAPPAGPAPWLRATFDDFGGTGTVQLTLETMGLVGTEYVSEWDFSLDPALSPGSLSISKTSGPTTAAISTGTDSYKADGDGYYDIQFLFPTGPPSARFDAGSAAMVFSITGIPTLTASSFLALSTPTKDSTHGPFYSAAHVQGIADIGKGTSGWVSGAPASVPDGGATAFLLGLGMLGLGAVRRRALK